MPGLVLFRRRWAIATDDLVFPSILLIISHVIWITVEILVFILIYQSDDKCSQMLRIYLLGNSVIMSIAVILEACIGWITRRGSIMNTSARRPCRPFLYTRCALFLMECGWMIFGIVWLGECYTVYKEIFPKAVLLGVIIFNAILLFIILTGVYLSYDLGGSKWLKLRKYEANVQSTGSKLHHGSGAPSRNWRTSFVFGEEILLTNITNGKLFEPIRQVGIDVVDCYFAASARAKGWTSLGEIAQLLSDFFRDLDLVPSDIVAGLILLRRYQKLRRHALLAQNKCKIYRFLSGAPITPETKFLHLEDPVVFREYKQLVRYMRFSLAVYGWPMHVCRGKTCCKLCGIVPGLRCICCFWLPERMPGLDVLDDNCCMCNSSAMWAVMESVAEDESIQFVHASYTGGVGMTPYFLALDHLEKKIVVTIRGTLSMKDIVTDLNADAEFIPVDPLQTNPPWLAHKGMVAAAEYVKKKLIQEGKLMQMLDIAKTRTGDNYDLLLVGHSLGGGTAAILAIMLKPQFPALKCICFSPPGGLLNLPAAEYSKDFITTCLLGKDMVARLGLHQLEAMRSDLLNVIQRSTCPKWKTLLASISGCLYPKSPPDPALKSFAEEQAAKLCQEKRAVSPYMTTHPPMYLPGKIIQIVRRYPDEENRLFKGCNNLACRKSQRKGEPTYQAMEAERQSFYEICLSPSMVDDHMPDTLLSAMERVLETATASRKLTKNINGVNSNISFEMLDSPDSMSTSSDSTRAVRTTQPLWESSVPVSNDLTRTYTAIDEAVTPTSVSPYSEQPPHYRPASSCSSRLTIPITGETTQFHQSPVKIYTSLVDQGTSSYTLGSPDSTMTFSETTQADIHKNHRGSASHLTPDGLDLAARGSSTPRVMKAKSLNEMSDESPLSNRKKKRNISAEGLVDSGGRRHRKRSSAGSANLQIPSETPGYRTPDQRRSRESLVVAKLDDGSKVEVQAVKARRGDDDAPIVIPSSGPSHNVDAGAYIVNLIEKTQYGTIYYV